MKITFEHRSKLHGMVLPMTLCMILILSIIIVAFSRLTNNRNLAVSRSQSWNQAIPVLESGVEEALTQLHYTGTNSSLLTSNNWTYGLDGLYHKTRTFSDGSYYSVSIQGTNTPIILSTGFVPVLVISSTNSTNYVSRRVKVVATRTSVAGPGGVTARGTISIGSGNSVDSFDSSNPNYSSNGVYVASMHEAGALLLTDSSNKASISIGTATIYGSVSTGPGPTTGSQSVVTISGGVVGDAAYDANPANAGTIETSRQTTDAHVQINEVQAPFTYGTGYTPTLGTVGGTNYTYVVGTGNYNMDALTMASGQSLVVNGNAVLYVNGGVNISSTGYIYITPGSSLSLYIGGVGKFQSSSTIAGQGVVNGTQLASQCAIYGLSGCTAINYSGQSSYIGTIDAPDADFKITGNASAIGAFTVNSFNLSGNGGLHYDQALGSTGAPGGYVVISWNEF